MEVIFSAQRLKTARKRITKSMDVLELKPGTEARVYRENSKSWEGPFKLVSYDGNKTVHVDTGKGPVPFSMSTVALFRRESEDYTAPSNKVVRVGRKIRVYWPLDDKYYNGTIASHDEETG